MDFHNYYRKGDAVNGPLLHNFADGLRRIGIGRSKGYELVAAGELRVVKIGRRTLIAEDELQRYVRKLTETGAE